MEVICLESEAFYSLINKVVERIKEEHKVQEPWLDTEAAMSLLGIKSKTTLQNLRDKGQIRFTQPQRKLILYDRESILSYLDKHAKDTF